MSVAQNLPASPISLETFWEMAAANPDKRLEYRDGAVIDKDATHPYPTATLSRGEFWELVAANSDKRLEYCNGIVVEKSIADNCNYAIINAHCEAHLRTALRGKCSVFSCDTYVQTVAGNLYLPDLSVACIAQSHDKCTILVSPELVVEVVPQVTVAFDSFTKLSDYRDCLSITTILLIWQDQRHVEVHERESERLWSVRTLKDNENYQLRYLPILLDLSEIYDDVEEGES